MFLELDRRPKPEQRKLKNGWDEEEIKGSRIDGRKDAKLEYEMRGSESQEDEWALKSPDNKCPRAGDKAPGERSE